MRKYGMQNANYLLQIFNGKLHAYFSSFLCSYLDFTHVDFMKIRYGYEVKNKIQCVISFTQKREYCKLCYGLSSFKGRAFRSFRIFKNCQNGTFLPMRENQKNFWAKCVHLIYRKVASTSTSRLVTCLILQHPQSLDFMNSDMSWLVAPHVSNQIRFI